MGRANVSPKNMGASAVTRIATGEMDARFVDDVIPYLGLLAWTARRYMHNPRDAEDLIQDTLLKAYTGFHSFRTGTNLKAWLLQIMKRTSIDLCRARQRRPVEVLTGVFTDSSTSDTARFSPHVSPSAETEMLDSGFGTEIQAAFGSLAEPIRRVVYYADFEGRTYGDIAAILNIPVGTVVSRLHRGRTRMRDRLADSTDPRRDSAHTREQPEGKGPTGKERKALGHHAVGSEEEYQ